MRKNSGNLMRQIDQALMESENQRLSWVLDTVGIGLWLNELPLGKLNWDERTKELFFVPPGTEPTIELFWSRIHPDDREPTALAVDIAIRDHTLYEIDHRVVDPVTGSVRWLRSSGQAIYSDDGTPVRFDGINYDITERRISDAIIKRNEERNRIMSEAASELLASQKPQEVIDNICLKTMRFLKCQVFFNYLLVPEVKKLHLNAFFGIDETEAEKIEWLESTDTVCGCVAYYGQRIIAEDIQKSGDMRANLVRKYGVQAYCCHPLRSSDKVIGTLSFGTTERTTFSNEEVSMMEAVSGLISVAFQRKRLEEELLHSRDELEKSGNKLDLALENANIGLWEWNLINDEVMLDSRTIKMMGLKPGSFKSTREEFERHVHEEDLEHIKKATSDTIKNNLPYETIFRVKHPDGKSRYISAKALANRDAAGNLISLTGVYFDITELREGTERLIFKLNEELLRSNKELENFAYITSHDLQEPLRMVTSYTQLLELRYRDKLDDNAREYIQHAIDGAKRMYELINGLLNYSRISRKDIVLTDIEITKIIEIIESNLAVTIKEKNCTIEANNLPVVKADQHQMIQLFQNLIGNAIKFCRKNPHITISAVHGRSYHTFSISDNGIGIDPQYFERIFQIFKRLHPRDQYEGTGIGLAICKRIVENHGGKIWLESKPGKGSVFHFTIADR